MIVASKDEDYVLDRTDTVALTCAGCAAALRFDRRSFQLAEQLGDTSAFCLDCFDRKLIAKHQG